MNTKSTITTLVIAIILLGCEKAEIQVDNLINKPIKITTQVNTIETRAGYDNENKPTELGIYIDPSTSNTKYTYINEQMTSTDAGLTWTPQKTMLWENSTNKVTVTAYTPYSNLTSETRIITGASIKSDQSTAEAIKESDYLFYKDEVNPNIEGIAIPFKHALAKINLSIMLGTEFNNLDGTKVNPISEVQIGNTYISFDWNLTDGTTSSNSKLETIIPWCGTYTPGEGINATATSAIARYEAIVVPQSVAANTFIIAFKVNGKSYSWKSTKEIVWKENTAYKLSLTAGKDIVSMGDLTVVDWSNGSTGNIATE